MTPPCRVATVTSLPSRYFGEGQRQGTWAMTVLLIWQNGDSVETLAAIRSSL